MASFTPIKGENEEESSSQAAFDKLDDLLKGCTPLEIEDPCGVEYNAGLIELKKVFNRPLQISFSSPLISACMTSSTVQKYSASIFEWVKLVVGQPFLAKNAARAHPFLG